ncbi:hypothetical protein [Rubrivirga sp.]
MRRLARTERSAAVRLAAEHGVNHSAAYSAISGKTWKHLPTP